jgi:hypothetical protein
MTGWDKWSPIFQDGVIVVGKLMISGSIWKGMILEFGF